MLNKPAAVETRLGTAAAEAIRRSEQGQGLDHDVRPRAVRTVLRLSDDAEHGQREADHEPARPRPPMTAHPLATPVAFNEPQNSAFERENLKNSAG